MREVVRMREELEGVKVVNLAGEALDRKLVEEVREKVERGGGEVRVVNLYGPSEDTTYSTYEEVKRGEGMVSIGRAIGGSRVMVLGEEMEKKGIGVEGEIYIGGEGLARSYIGRREETAERFVPDPYEGGGGRMYRTGDIGKVGADGKVYYIGRRDNQVKVRGYRIEMGEIEEQMKREEGVEEAVAIVREQEGGEKRIVGYVKVREKGGGERVREEMMKRMPEYMVPSVIVEMEEMPHTPNGKIDRKRLPEVKGIRSGGGHRRKASNEMEEVISGIWEELLGMEEVGVDENFFELGGHSLLATQVVAKVRDRFKVNLELLELLEEPTIMSLCKAVEKARQMGEKREKKRIEPISRERHRVKVSREEPRSETAK
jgi:acyl carrier protein